MDADSVRLWASDTKVLCFQIMIYVSHAKKVQLKLVQVHSPRSHHQEAHNKQVCSIFKIHEVKSMRPWEV